MQQEKVAKNTAKSIAAKKSVSHQLKLTKTDGLITD